MEEIKKFSLPQYTPQLSKKSLLKKSQVKVTDNIFHMPTGTPAHDAVETPPDPLA